MNNNKYPLLLREALLTCWCELVERAAKADMQGNLFCTDERLDEIWEEVEKALLGWKP